MGKAHSLFPILTHRRFHLKPNRFIPKFNVNPKAARRMLILFANTLGFATLYYVLPVLGFFYMPHVYLIGGGALSLWYILYNRGFSLKGKTPDMLSDTLSLEERQELIRASEEHFEKTRWVLLILLPLLLVFLIDTIYLFMIPEGLFS